MRACYFFAILVNGVTLKSTENLTLAEETSSTIQAGAGGSLGLFAHRRTQDGRLCAQTAIVDSQSVSDCTYATNPDGIAGKEWHVGRMNKPG